MPEIVPSGAGRPAEQNDGQGRDYQRTPEPGKLASERVIINAPMSFAGAAQRSWRLLGKISDDLGGSVWVRRLVVAPFVVIPLVLLPWWALVLCWYLVFGLWLVPYRLLRRGARKRKAEALRHRELLSALASKQD